MQMHCAIIFLNVDIAILVDIVQDSRLVLFSGLVQHVIWSKVEINSTKKDSLFISFINKSK